MTQRESERDRLARPATGGNKWKEPERGYPTKHPYYNVWCNMRARCNFPSAQAYAYYGARGIKVCKRWNESFWDYVDDIGPKPGPGYSIDRIDNNGDYEPSNVRWATKKQQSDNQRMKFTNTSGVENINWREDRGLYIVQKNFNGKKVSAGQYGTLNEAIKALVKINVDNAVAEAVQQYKNTQALKKLQDVMTPEIMEKFRKSGFKFNEEVFKRLTNQKTNEDKR